KLANDGHDTRALQHYLGHKNIQHTVRYTDMAPDRFRTFGGADLRPWASWCRRFRAPASSGRLPLPPLSPWRSALHPVALSTLSAPRATALAVHPSSP